MLTESDCSLQVKWTPYCTKYGNACASLTWTVRLLCLARETEQTNLPLSNSSGLIFASRHQEHCFLRERTRLQRLICGRLLRSWALKCPIGELAFMERCAIICCYPTASAKLVGLNICGFCFQVEYLLCYACAGPILQFCVLPRGSNIPRMLGTEISMGTQAGRLRIIAVAIQVYQVIKAQRAHLPDHYFPLGWTDHSSFSSIEYFDGYVQVSCTNLLRNCFFPPKQRIDAITMSCFPCRLHDAQ